MTRNLLPLLAFFWILMGCETPTTPTYDDALHVMGKVDTVRIISEVDHLPDYSDPVDGRCPSQTVPRLKAAIRVQGDKVIGLSFLVLKCVEAI